MATSDSAPISTSVSDSFHYETKYIVLHYLGLHSRRSQAPPTAEGGGWNERERTREIKEQIEEELKKLEDEITISSSRTGLDLHSSLVFHPSDPHSSVEDCLASIGDGVAVEAEPQVSAAVDALLLGTLDYQRFRDATLALSVDSQGGWRKVLLPLVLLQSLLYEGQPLVTLVHLGVRFLEETEAEFIVQQGGWGEVFGLVSEEDRGVTIAEDSNDIYILSGEQHPDPLSPPSSLLCVDGTSSGRSSWQAESLPVSLAGHESWAQVGAMDPEDLKSLDSNEGGALTEERSENNSSNSDIVHVEREEAELLEEGGEGGAIEESMMSVLGTESDLAELREELKEEPPDGASSSEAPASLMSLEEPVVIETPVSLSAEPSFISLEPELPPPPPDAAAPPAQEPEPTAASPVPEPEPEPEPQPEPEPAAAPVPVEVAPPSLAQVAPPSPAKEAPVGSSTEPEEPEAPSEPLSELVLESATVPPEPQEPPPQPEPEAEPEAVPAEPPIPEAVVAPVEAPAQEPPVEPASELPVLLYGGAALVALTAVMAYGVIAYRRK